MIETLLYEHLKTSVPLVGGRVFANIMHQDTAKPALVYLVTSERPHMSLSPECLGSEMEWVIYSYAEAYTQNKEIKNEVIAALKSFSPRAKEIQVSDGFDEESELFVQVIKFKTNQRG